MRSSGPLMKIGFAVAFILTISPIWSYPTFQTKLPNGDKVPDPCKTGNIWGGVGHIIAAGGTKQLNPFGEAFKANGFTWDKTLCEMDSDGDGKTNGAELGDPKCTWKQGAEPSTAATGHPGINEEDKPVWLKCPAGEECPIFGEEGTKSAKLLIGDELPVPAKVTTYQCKYVELPKGGPFHYVGHKPVIANKNVMHHIIMYACNPDAAIDPNSPSFECGMGGSECQELLGGWAYGSDNTCFDDSGIKFGGASSFLGGPITHVMLQMHWNNPEKVSTYTDSSGLEIFYTDKLRTHDMGFVMTGPLVFGIPPKMKHYQVYGDCQGVCTNLWPEEEYTVVYAFPHMHGLGKRQKMEIWRNNEKVETIFDDTKYDYNAPSQFKISNIKIKKGDSLVTMCDFDSTSRENVTTFGEGTYDEMCFSFIYVYPPPPNSRCMTLNDDQFKAIAANQTGKEIAWDKYPDRLRQGVMNKKGICGIGGAVPKTEEMNSETEKQFRPLVEMLKARGVELDGFDMAELMENSAIKTIMKTFFGEECELATFSRDMGVFVENAMLDCPAMTQMMGTEMAIKEGVQQAQASVLATCGSKCNVTLGKLEMHPCMTGLAGVLLKEGLKMMNPMIGKVVKQQASNCGFKATSTFGTVPQRTDVTPPITPTPTTPETNAPVPLTTGSTSPAVRLAPVVVLVGCASALLGLLISL